MKNLTILLVVIAFLTASCNRPYPDHQDSVTAVPTLLERQSLISPVEEVGQVHLAYQKIKADIEQDPSNALPWLELAELFLLEARISGEHGYYYPQALQVIQEVQAMDLNNDLRFRALCDEASVLLSQHQFQEAKKKGEQALELNPYNASVYGILVDAHVELGQYEEAVAMSDKMVSIRPDLRSYSRVSYLREIFGFPEGAIEAMKMAVAAGYPGTEQTEWARLTLGNLYETYGTLDSAKLAYEAALAARPNFPFALAALADWEAKAGDPAKAQTQMEKACLQIPEVGFYISRANWAKNAGQTAQFEALTTEILDMLQDDVESGHQMNLELAEVYLELLDKPAKALEYAIEEFEARPENITVNTLLSRIYLALGDTSNAKRNLSRALATNSKDPQLIALKHQLEGSKKTRPTENRLSKEVKNSSNEIEPTQ